MHWAQTIPDLSPAFQRRAASIQERKARLNAEAAELKDRILSEISKLVDEEVELYHDIARKKRWTKGLDPTAIAAMEYPTLCRLLEGKPEDAGEPSKPNGTETIPDTIHE